MAPLITITIHAILSSVGLKQIQAPIPPSVPKQIQNPITASSIKPYHEQPVKAYGPADGTISLSAISWGANRNDVYGVTSGNDTISHKWWDGQGWGPSADTLEDLGGASYTAPVAVSWGENRMDVFSVSAIGDLTHKYWDGTAWQPSETDVETLGSGIDSSASSLAATSWGEGRLDVFGIESRGRVLLHKYFDGSQWNPQDDISNLEDLGGDLSTGVSAVSWGPDRMDIVGASDEQEVQHIYYDGTKWSEWESLPGSNVSITEPTIVSWGVNRLDIFGINLNDGALWHTAWDGSQWLAWESLGGSNLLSPVAAKSWGPNRIDILALGEDNSYYYKFWDGSQWNPTDATLYQKAGNFSSVPALASWGVNRLDIFGVTTDKKLAHQTWYGSGWFPEWTFEDLGGALDTGSIETPAVHKELR